MKRAKKVLSVVGVIVLVAGAVAQCFPPRRNTSTGPYPNDLLVLHPAPPAVADLLHAVCYDCHSDNTRYPWYTRIQPVGWWMADHIKDGKRHINFSQFGAMPKSKAARKLGDCSDVIFNKGMPLTSYQISHTDARLTKEQRDMLIKWFDDLSDKLGGDE